MSREQTQSLSDAALANARDELCRAVSLVNMQRIALMDCADLGDVRDEMAIASRALDHAVKFLEQEITDRG